MVLVLQCSTLCDHCSLFLDKNSNAHDASKKFWMQKAQLNWVFLTWSLCFIALLFMTIVLCFLFPLFLDKNSNARGGSKKFWVQKAQLNWVFLTWSLCFIALLFVWFLFSLFLGFALHNIHASYFRLFLFSFYKIKKNKK